MSSSISNNRTGAQQMGILYSKLKVFHFKEKLDSLPRDAQGILAPLHVRIKPTNVCGHRCWYCAYRTDYLQLGRDMGRADSIPEPKMMEIMDDIVEMGVKAVTFSGGGDPFFYPHLLAAVKRLIGTDVRFASLTNGSRLEGEISEVFAHNASWLRVSIDGWDNKSYAEYRGVSEDEFGRVMRNLERFAKYGGGCLLGASLIVDRKNASHVFELASRLKDSGVTSVKITPCITSNSGRENNEYHTPIFDVVREQTQKTIEELADAAFEVNDDYHFLKDAFEKTYTWCPFQQVLHVIGADLNIYPCQDKAYNLEEGLLGTIKDKRYRDFWFENKDTFFKINPAIHCNHKCTADPKNKLILEYFGLDKGHLGFV